jgi:hypothetical protein
MSPEGRGQDPQPPAQETPAWMAPYLPVTAEDKARAGFFDGHGAWTLKPGFGVVTSACGIGFDSGEPPMPYYDFVAQKACSADVAVVGTVSPVAVRLNNKRSYLFTEFTVQVSRWLRSAGTQPRRLDVLMPGAHIVTPEGPVTVSISGVRQFEPGKEYLLLLKRIPGTTAFTPSMFLTADANWASLLGGNLPYELRDDQVPFDRFVDDLENAARSCSRSR